jgi:hypothetical protein
MELITLQLSRNDIGQILDGLEARAASWRNTAEYLANDGDSADDSFVIEECTDEAEAAGIADHYAAIIAAIRAQLPGPKIHPSAPARH